MARPLASNRSSVNPTSRVLLPDGSWLCCNGLDLPLRYDGRTLENAGMPAVTIGSFSATPSGSGVIDGKYYFAVRMVDDEGIPGNLSEVKSFTASADALVTYGNLPVSGDTRTAKREVYRGLIRQILYLDKTVNDNSTTSTTSVITNSILRTRSILAINAPDGTINARRYGRPPVWARHVVYHQNRTHWMVANRFEEGHAEYTASSQAVNIIGAKTGCLRFMVGQKIVNQDGSASGGIEYAITAVSALGGFVRMATAWPGDTNKFAKYSIYPGKSKINTIIPSYGGEPESVNPEDAVELDSDKTNEEELTGGFSLHSFLYVTTAANIFRWPFLTDPVRAGIYPDADRGCVNERCAVRGNIFVYLMDREGFYRFNGSPDDSIGDAVADYVDNRISWGQSKWFFAVWHPVDSIVRFFVSLDGSYYPKHALAYSEQTGEWWEETYPWQIAAATVIPAPIHRKLICGSSCERILAMDAAGDTGGGLTATGVGLPSSGRYTVTAATAWSVTVSGADWNNADMEYAPIEIVAGSGRKQQRLILSANKITGKILIDRPWHELPDVTGGGVVCVGGIHYTAITKPYEMIDGEEKKVELQFQPTRNEQTVELALAYNQATTALTAQINQAQLHGGTLVKGQPWISHRLTKARTDGEWDGRVWVEPSERSSARGPSNRYLTLTVDGCANREQVVLQTAKIEGVG